MNPYINLFFSALAAGVACGTAVASTTHDPWPIGIASLGGFATSITQHLRSLPRTKWTEEQRAKKR